MKQHWQQWSLKEVRVKGMKHAHPTKPHVVKLQDITVLKTSYGQRNTKTESEWFRQKNEMTIQGSSR